MLLDVGKPKERRLKLGEISFNCVCNPESDKSQIGLTVGLDDLRGLFQP